MSIKRYLIGLAGLGASSAALAVISLVGPLLAASPTCNTSSCTFYNGGQPSPGQCGLNTQQNQCGCKQDGGGWEFQSACGAPPA